MSFQNLVDAQGINGISLAITGMAIVFVVLILVTMFISWLPRVLPILNGILPAIEHRHVAVMPSSVPRTGTPPAHEEEIVAAIGFALHRYRQSRQQH